MIKKMDKNNLIILIIAGLVLLILGGAAGFFYKTLQISPQLAVIKDLSSKTIPSIVAYGQVSKIEGRDITLSFNGDNIKVSVEANSPVYSFVNDAKGKPIQKKVELKEIKIGDSLNITIKLLPDGQLRGQSVFIFLSTPSILPL